MNAFVNPDEQIICPYDPNHKVTKGKLGFHLVRCRKNHPNAGIAVCDYNQEHRIPKPELKYHLETCMDRIATEARPRALQEENVMSFPIASDIVTPTEQSWGQLDHPGYDSESVTDQHNVLRTIAVEKPSLKKQFRAEEQRRMNAIRAPNGPGSSSQGASSSSNNENVSPTKQNHSDEKSKCSIEERLNSGLQTTYVPANTKESEWTTQKNRKDKK